MATAPTAVETPPPPGAYLTDDKRLCEVVGVDRDGRIILEDCGADSDDPSPPITITCAELLREWRLVRRVDAD
jgi:hypothetical protein